MTPTNFDKHLALYRVLDTARALVRGLALPDLERRWLRTGLRLTDLPDVLTRGDRAGDFAVRDHGGERRVHAGWFEQRHLNPSNLDQIQMLADSFGRLDVFRRRVRGPSFGRRAGDTGPLPTAAA
ncbi:MAG TPA: hypothetical protein VM369_09500 [Candidatus Binatia bacterium]|nr:hypothetical protein [Candidatus Binatia bacterium]